MLFSFGCSILHPKPVIYKRPAQEPVTPPKPTTEPQPAAPSPEKTEPAKEPEEPVTPPVPTPEPRSTVPSPTQPEKSAPRAVASLRLTEQARLLIASKKPDDAISILEKAMNIDSNNGQNYYYLAEAWIIKGNKKQATEFNRMAGMYLKNDAGWALKVRQQKEVIEKMKSTERKQG